MRGVSITQPGLCQDCPHRRMAVLAAVFAQAGRVALDIARVKRRAVEGRREKQRQPGVRPHKVPRHRRHRLPRAIGSAAPDSTAQDCAMLSMRHSSDVDEPRSVPSSKVPR
jgi:hypothetical protein